MKIINDLKECLYSLKDGDKVWGLLVNADENTPCGKYEFNENLFVKLMRYDLKREFDGVLEIHRDFIDLQYLISGGERFFTCKKEGCPIVKEYDGVNDCEFICSDEYSYTDCNEGQGVWIDAGKPHASCVFCGKGNSVFKAVIKIAKTSVR